MFCIFLLVFAPYLLFLAYFWIAQHVPLAGYAYHRLETDALDHHEIKRSGTESLGVGQEEKKKNYAMVTHWDCKYLFSKYWENLIV